MPAEDADLRRHIYIGSTVFYICLCESTTLEWQFFIVLHLSATSAGKNGMHVLNVV